MGMMWSSPPYRKTWGNTLWGVNKTIHSTCTYMLSTYIYQYLSHDTAKHMNLPSTSCAIQHHLYIRTGWWLGERQWEWGVRDKVRGEGWGLLWSGARDHTNHKSWCASLKSVQRTEQIQYYARASWLLIVTMYWQYTECTWSDTWYTS